MTAKLAALHHVQLPRYRLRKTAKWLLSFRSNDLWGADTPKASQDLSPVTVVCISDTHNLQPPLPPGDLLVHAGDLTEWGTFDEIQAQLSWLSSQPHEHKIVIAGNHDLLFDEAFLAKHPEHRDPEGRQRDDLDFGSVTYLRDESETLSFANGKRVLNMYGSPWTPRCGTSAFQYPQGNDVWSNRVPSSTGILIMHGPPAGFNNIRPSAGCAFLRREVARVKPRLMIFGHIHVARGEQTVVFDAAQLLYDDIVDDARGWDAVPLLAFAV
ncbi:hypothetical protein B0A48_04360 [Cryoendolithus antarcticus]|uniref:Calcineurin-like phosphoesterase domain-containing protein n=1 Tax=Cryoendolithus antarcticus TaxID=1507870 RepID=A0A1V8TF57_9PEZI|nr:hypothetical protein B0A48_04360 [Cryoendolithus antarcticus]